MRDRRLLQVVEIVYQDGLYVFHHELGVMEKPYAYSVIQKHTHKCIYTLENLIHELMSVDISSVRIAACEAGSSLCNPAHPPEAQDFGRNHDITEDEYVYMVFHYSADNQYLLKRIVEMLNQVRKTNIVFISSEIESRTYICKNSHIYFIKTFDEIAYIETLAEFTVLQDFNELESIPGIYHPVSETARAAFVNGFRAFMTGEYTGNISNELAKHIAIRPMLLGKNICFPDNFDLNSALIIYADSYMDNIHELLACQKSYFGNNIFQVVKEKVYFNADPKPYSFIQMSYKEYVDERNAGRLNGDLEHYVSIRTKDDLEYFLLDISLFKEKGIILDYKVNILDECCWSNSCSVCNLFRYTVTGDLLVKPCGGGSADVSFLEERYHKELSVRRQKDKNYIKRGCRDCTAGHVCAKCAFLPECISAEEYCKIMQNNPYLQEYFLKKHLMRKIAGNIHILNSNYDRIHFSNQAYSLIYHDDKKAADPKRIIYLFEMDAVFYVLHFRDHTVIRIDERLAFILEGYSFGNEIEKIYKQYSAHYHLPVSEACQIVKRGFHTLKEKNLL